MSSERHLSVLVEIIYTLSGRGLAKDAELLRDTICALGHEVSVKALLPQHPLLRNLSNKWSRVKNRLPSRHALALANLLQRRFRRLLSINTPNADLVIHLENIHPHYINPSCPNWLIPNQEWFRPERIPYLTDIDMVLCKTFTAKECFQAYHRNVQYLGFSTPVAQHRDEWELPEKNSSRILHIAGANRLKGTEVVLAAWKQNPQWPRLMLVANNPYIDHQVPTNVELKSSISDEDLQVLWREADIVVAPSEVEGYGQVLAEAMIYGAVIITTDAPPMNELVNDDRGYLIPYSETMPFRLGMRYKISKENLELVLNKALNDSDELRKNKAVHALNWARHNHEAFIQRLGVYVKSATPNPRNADQLAGRPQA